MEKEISLLLSHRINKLQVRAIFLLFHPLALAWIPQINAKTLSNLILLKPRRQPTQLKVNGKLHAQKIKRQIIGCPVDHTPLWSSCRVRDLSFHQLRLSVGHPWADHYQCSISQWGGFGFELGLIKELILTRADPDWDVNPGSHGCRPSPLPLSYPAVQLMRW